MGRLSEYALLSRYGALLPTKHSFLYAIQMKIFKNRLNLDSDKKTFVNR